MSTQSAADISSRVDELEQLLLKILSTGPMVDILDHKEEIVRVMI